MLVETKARVGVFAIALGAYLPQFPSLVPEFQGQYEHFKTTVPNSVELIDGGIVTTKELAQQAGDKFRAADVDLVILQLLTYATSYNMLPAVRDLDVPVVLVNVQKLRAPDYENTGTAQWLGELYACGAVGEMVADLERAGKRHAVITGVVEGGDPVVQAEIEDWCKAAQVRRRFRDLNLAQIGRPYPGMMDLYIDETNLYHRMWLYTKQFDWEKMWAIADGVTDEAAIRQKAQDILDTFDIEGGGTVEKVWDMAPRLLHAHQRGRGLRRGGRHQSGHGHVHPQDHLRHRPALGDVLHRLQRGHLHHRPLRLRGRGHLRQKAHHEDRSRVPRQDRRRVPHPVLPPPGACHLPGHHPG